MGHEIHTNGLRAHKFHSFLNTLYKKSLANHIQPSIGDPVMHMVMLYNKY